MRIGGNVMKLLGILRGYSNTPYLTRDIVEDADGMYSVISPQRTIQVPGLNKWQGGPTANSCYDAIVIDEDDLNNTIEFYNLTDGRAKAGIIVQKETTQMLILVDGRLHIIFNNLYGIPHEYDFLEGFVYSRYLGGTIDLDAAAKADAEMDKQIAKSLMYIASIKEAKAALRNNAPRICNNTVTDMPADDISVNDIMQLRLLSGCTNEKAKEALEATNKDRTKAMQYLKDDPTYVPINLYQYNGPYPIADYALSDTEKEIVRMFADDVIELRRLTGSGLGDCLKALDATGRDQDKAIGWLKGCYQHNTKTPIKFGEMETGNIKGKEYMITKESIIELREETGYGMMNCKKALMVTDGDHDKAIQWLKDNSVAYSLINHRPIVEDSKP